MTSHEGRKKIEKKSGNGHSQDTKERADRALEQEREDDELVRRVEASLALIQTEHETAEEVKKIIAQALGKPRFQVAVFASDYYRRDAKTVDAQARRIAQDGTLDEVLSMLPEVAHRSGIVRTILERIQGVVHPLCGSKLPRAHEVVEKATDILEKMVTETNPYDQYTYQPLMKCLERMDTPRAVKLKELIRKRLQDAKRRL